VVQANRPQTRNSAIVHNGTRVKEKITWVRREREFKNHAGRPVRAPGRQPDEIIILHARYGMPSRMAAIIDHSLLQQYYSFSFTWL
jgi:hypothetical protein